MKTKQQGSALILSIAMLLAISLLGKYFLTANQHYHDVFTHSLVDAKLRLHLYNYAQWIGGMVKQDHDCQDIMHEYTKLDLDGELKVTTKVECSEQTDGVNSQVQYTLNISGEVGSFGSEMYHHKNLRLTLNYPS